MIKHKNDHKSIFKILFSLTLLTLACSLLLAADGQAKRRHIRPEGPMKYWTKAEFKAYMSRLEGRGFRKALTSDDRKNSSLHDGNKVRTLFFNYGSIGRPNTEPSMEWPAFSSHGYAYEFGTIVGAGVVDARGDTIHIFSDGMLDGGDYDATGGSNWWGWEPLPGYAAAGQDIIAMSNRSETWGSEFPTDLEGNLLWPGQFGDGVITADLESFYIMDDRHNAEFKYYPVPSDSTIRGLGIEVEVRGYQYAAGAAEAIIFFQYKITNVGEKRLEKAEAELARGCAGARNDGWSATGTGRHAEFAQRIQCWADVGSRDSRQQQVLKLGRAHDALAVPLRYVRQLRRVVGGDVAQRQAEPQRVGAGYPLRLDIR